MLVRLVSGLLPAVAEVEAVVTTRMRVIGHPDGSQELAAQKSRYGPNRGKYGAQPTEVDGIRFASKKEAARYQTLRAVQLAGAISDLRLQVPFPLHVGGQKIGTYLADFVYVQGGETVVEDVKGVRTPMYRWKARHLRAEYGISIRET